MERRDIKIEKAYISANNDFEWFVSDKQHIQDIIEAMPGEYKENPTMGVGIGMFLNSSGQEAKIARKVIIELQRDLYQSTNPSVSFGSDGKLNINPNL